MTAARKVERIPKTGSDKSSNWNKIPFEAGARGVTNTRQLYEQYDI
jgi:hypothetical protein